MQSLSLVSVDEVGEGLGCICCQLEQELLPPLNRTYMQSLSLVSVDEVGEGLGCICCQEEQELLPPLN